MRGSRTTSNLIFAGVLGLGTIVGLAGPVLADTPPAPQGVDDIAAAQVLPGPGDKAPPQVPPVDPGGFGGPDQIADDPGCTATHGCDDPTDPGEPCRDAAGAVIDCAPPIDGGDPDRGDEPCRDVAGAVVECTPPTDGGDPGRGDEPTPGDDPTPTDVPSAGDPVDSSVQVAGQVETRQALPRTGAGLAVLAGVGAGLTGLGAALRKLSRR